MLVTKPGPILLICKTILLSKFVTKSLISTFSNCQNAFITPPNRKDEFLTWSLLKLWNPAKALSPIWSEWQIRTSPGLPWGELSLRYLVQYDSKLGWICVCVLKTKMTHWMLTMATCLNVNFWRRFYTPARQRGSTRSLSIGSAVFNPAEQGRTHGGWAQAQEQPTRPRRQRRHGSESCAHSVG